MFEKYTRILLIGDSITDVGRARPIGNKNAGMGNGYPNYVETILAAKYPEDLIWVENMGISGNTSRDLVNRWDTDVLERKPDIVTVMIGANDVWRHFDCPFFPEGLISPEKYEENMRTIIGKTLDNGIKMVLITPYYLDLLHEDPMRKMCDELGAIVKKLAKEYNLPLVDIQAKFDEYLHKASTYRLSPDRVHPNYVGHYIIAEELLRTLGAETL